MTNSDPKTSAEPAFAQYPSHGRSMIQCKMMRRIDKIIIFFSDLARTLMKDVVIDVGIRLRMELGVKNRYLIKNWWTSNLMKSCAKIRCWDENTENRLWNRDFLLCSYSSNLFQHIHANPVHKFPEIGILSSYILYIGNSATCLGACLREFTDVSG